MNLPWKSLTCLALTLGTVSCASSSTQNSEDKISVVASHDLLCHLTETLAQETINLACLIDSDQDFHSYRPTPSDKQTLEKAQLILFGGSLLNPEIEKLVNAAPASIAKIAVYEEAVPNPILAEAHTHGEDEHHEKHEGEAHHDEHGEEAHHEKHGEDEHHDEHKGEAHHDEHGEEAHHDEPKVADPHIWHDVSNVVSIIDIIQNQLIAVNPDAQETYTTNGQNLKEELDKLNIWVQQQVDTIPPSQRTLITTHDAFNYYLQAYGFQDSQALQGLSSQDSPTAAGIKELVEKIKGTQVPTIFAEMTTSDQVIETVAREAKVKVSQDPLIADGLGTKESSTDTYIGMITHNTCAIVEGLGGQCTPFEESF